MSTETGNVVKKKKFFTKRKIIVFSVILAIILGFWILSTVTAKQMQSAAVAAMLAQRSEFPLEKEDISSQLAISGTVQSNTSVNIYTTLNYPVQEIMVEKGSTVKKGDVLAQLDTTDLLQDIEQTKNNLENARLTYQNELQSTNNSITNASSTLDSNTNSLERQLALIERYREDLEDAKKDLADGFDTYSHQKTVDDTVLKLDRLWADLEDAEADLLDFDDYDYQNKVDDAYTALKNSLISYENTVYSLDVSNDNAKYRNSYQGDIEDEIDDLKDDAYDFYNGRISQNEFLRSVDRFIDCSQDYADDQRDNSATISSVSSLISMSGSIQTGANSLVRAIEGVDRAQDSSRETIEDKIKTLKQNIEDAERTLAKAKVDLADGEKNGSKSLEDKVKTAQRNYEDAVKQLESLQINVDSSKNSLAQAKGKYTTAQISVANYELSLQKLESNLEKSTIRATEDGVIVEKNLKVGATPTGILFTIEDPNSLYVKVKVKEYNVGDISLGQKATVTTDATGDEVFEAQISFISPSAITSTGTTSVDFEAWVEVKKPTEKMRIGMNAFANIILDERKDAFVVPISSVMKSPEGDCVYVNEGGIVASVPVSMGLESGTRCEISGDGLYEGLVILEDPEIYTLGSSVEDITITSAKSSNMMMGMMM